MVGGGPAGLTAAIALASAGLSTTLVAGQVRLPDNRTTALLSSSVTALDTIGVWSGCRPSAAPLRTLRIIDDTQRLWRAPEIKFQASEIGLEAFGWNIENRHLVAALAERGRTLANLSWIADTARSVDVSEASVAVTLSGGGDIVARLVVGADGQNSSVGKRPRSKQRAGAIDRSPSPSTWDTPDRTRTSQLNFTRNQVPSPWCRCQDCDRASWLF